VSDRLRRIFLDADRRVFPTQAPLDIQFPASDEAPGKLVPDEMLEVVSLPMEPIYDDPLEAFTYIGAVPGTPDPDQLSDPGPQWLSSPSAEHLVRPPSDDASPPSSEHTGELAPPSTDDEQPVRTETRASSRPAPGSAVVVPSLPDVGRHGDEAHREGPLREGDLVRLLFRCAEHRGELEVELALESSTDADGRRLELVLHVSDGEVRAMRGPVALRVVEELGRLGRLADVPGTDEQAVAALERAVVAGTLGRFELDRLSRRARESLLHDALEMPSGRFEVRRYEGAPLTARVLASSLRAVVVEGARRRLSTARVRRLLGSEALVVELAPRARELFAAAGLEPEVAGLFERHEGASLDVLLASAVPSEGLAGLCWALVSAGALRVRSGAGDARSIDPASALRDAVESAERLAFDGDYFAILGARPRSSTRELEQAWRERRRALTEMHLAAHGLEALEPARAAALAAVDEAWHLLSDEGLRARYRAALGL
jgi:hypothetical protein